MKQHSEWALARVTHGGYLGGKETSEHAIWRGMMARCYRKTSKDYARYGGRGVSVCERWHDYQNFIADMGVRPSTEHSIERLNPHANYEPDNCKWATRSEQQKNKTTTVLYDNGVFCGTLVECAKLVGISKELAHWRYKTWGTFQKGVIWHKRQKQK